MARSPGGAAPCGNLPDGRPCRVTASRTGSATRPTGRSASGVTALARGHASTVVNRGLFLPQTWDPASPKADPGKVARRAAYGIPDDVGHVEKWQLALDMLDETRSWGIDVPLVIADAGYGAAAAFRHGLQARSLTYVVGISTTMSAQPADAVPMGEPYSGNGRPPVPKYPDSARSVQELATPARSGCTPVSWPCGSGPPAPAPPATATSPPHYESDRALPADAAGARPERSACRPGPRSA
ncbi:transposase [Streptomyces massasporeus]|uniref:transposase n=1 Tax=Streptomyces massasporeus TaxID=67324 RepID=UPI0037FB115C